MIKEENRQNITIKDEMIQEMVSKTYKNLRELGQFQTVNQIFGKLPISRIQKQQYPFLFDSVKHNVEETINKQQLLRKMQWFNQLVYKNNHKKQARQRSRCLKKSKILPMEDNKIKGNVIQLSDYDFSHLIQNTFQQKLSSSRPIFKSILYLRNQEKSKNNFYGQSIAFLPDQQYLNMRQIPYEINDIRLLLQNQRLMKFSLQFVDENRIEFLSRNMPSSQDIEKRAQSLAKLYLLQFYRQQSRKAKQIYKNSEIQLNKQRQIKKIKQEMEIQKIKQGQMIEEMDLIKQVYKILMLIEKRMNELAFKEFTVKNGEKATIIKKSLQKLKKIINEQPSAKNKLKILITYKHKKGW